MCILVCVCFIMFFFCVFGVVVLFVVVVVFVVCLGGGYALSLNGFVCFCLVVLCNVCYV